MTAEQMAGQLEVSIRTIYRYIDILCASGAPIVSEAGHGGGFSLLPSFDDGVPLFFDRTELKAMVHGLMLTRQANYPYADSLQTALRKIEHRLLDAEREELKRQTEGIGVIPPSARPDQSRLLKMLEQAVVERRTVSVRYTKAERGELREQERILDPYGLLYRMGLWYLAAYCRTRRDERIFRVDRIREVVLTGETFERSGDVSVQEIYMRHAKGPPDADEAAIAVILHSGDESVLDQICNQWFLRKYVRGRSEGEARLRLPQETAMNLLPYILLSFGRGVRVAEPPSLRQAMSDLAQDLAKYYAAPELP
jgi:predicted DNA-binding transcriptional regulator YafY